MKILQSSEWSVLSWTAKCPLDGRGQAHTIYHHNPFIVMLNLFVSFRLPAAPDERLPVRLAEWFAHPGHTGRDLNPSKSSLSSSSTRTSNSIWSSGSRFELVESQQMFLWANSIASTSQILPKVDSLVPISGRVCLWQGFRNLVLLSQPTCQIGPHRQEHRPGILN